MTHPCPSLCSTTMICGRSLGTRSFTSRSCSLGSELDNADEVEDHDDDNDHAHDPNAAASSVHVDLLLSRTTRHARGGSWSYDSAVPLRARLLVGYDDLVDVLLPRVDRADRCVRSGTDRSAGNGTDRTADHSADCRSAEGAGNGAAYLLVTVLR